MALVVVLELMRGSSVSCLATESVEHCCVFC